MSANKRTIMYVVIAVICVIAIIIAVYYQFFAEKVVTESQVNQITNTVINTNSNEKSQADLLLEFNKLFTNELYKQKNSTDDIKKITGLEDEEIIYTAYDIVEKKDEKYEINVKLPAVNISGNVVAEFNNTTQSIFADKTSSILLETTGLYTIYNVEYVSYINNNILSLVIKSTLKEGNSAQRIIVQTYNYNLETGKKVTLNEILEAQEIDIDDVNDKIAEEVKQAKEQAETISGALGQSVYKRDLNNAMYLTNNVSTFFIGENGQIYIIFPYGNNNTTSEIDIIKL